MSSFTPANCGHPKPFKFPATLSSSGCTASVTFSYRPATSVGVVARTSWKTKKHRRFVAPGQSGGVEDAAGEVGDVEAGEGVWGAGVAAGGEEAGVLGGEGEDVGVEAGGLGVLVEVW